MWEGLFPDAPAWLVWTAWGLDALLVAFIAACLVASPLEAWANRHDHKGADREVHDLKRFQKIQADLSTAPTKQGVTAELARIGGHRKDV
jgi:hypothetical protein